MGDGVAAAAFVFERTSAGAGGVAPDVLLFGGWLGGFSDLVELEVAVDAVELDLGDGGFAERGALGFHEFDDFHGSFKAGGGGGFVVAEDLSKSVECEAGEVSELVQETVGSVVAGGEEDTGEVGVFLGPEVDGGAVNAGLCSGGGDGLACDESLQYLLLNGSESVEKCRVGCRVCGHVFPTHRLLRRI